MPPEVRGTSSAAPVEDAAGTVRLVPLTSLRASYARLRPGVLSSRAAAGVDLPARVVASPEGGYEILDGFKRVGRWQQAGHTMVPVVVETPASPIEHKRLLLVANAPPRTITALDEARVVSSLVTDDNLSPKAVGKLLGHTPDWVARRLKLGSRLGAVGQQKLCAGEIGPSLACALTELGIKDQEAILATAKEHQLSARECTRLVAAYRAADDTDRRRLLANPLAVARPELSRQATLSSTAVALERVLTGFRHTLADIGTFALPDDLAPPERRRLEALWRSVLDQLGTTAGALGAVQPASSIPAVPVPGHEFSADHASSPLHLSTNHHQENIDDLVDTATTGRSESGTRLSADLEPSGAVVASDGRSPIAAGATQATAGQTADGDHRSGTGGSPPAQGLLWPKGHRRPGRHQPPSGEPGPRGGRLEQGFGFTSLGQQQTRPVSRCDRGPGQEASDHQPHPPRDRGAGLQRRPHYLGRAGARAAHEPDR